MTEVSVPTDDEAYEDANDFDPFVDLQREKEEVNKCVLTIEPLLFLIMTVDCLVDPSIQNIYLDKVCQSLQYNQTVCDDMNKFDQAKIKIEEAAAIYILYAHVIRKLPGVFLAFFIGNWSDRNGKKLVIVLSFLGLMITNVFLLVNAHFRHWSVNFLLLSEIPHGMFGGWHILVGGCMSYLGDVVEVKHRSKRIGIAEIAFNGGCPIGYMISTLLFPVSSLIQCFLFASYRFIKHMPRYFY